MAECLVMIQEDFKKVYEVWSEIAECEADEITDEEIVCDDMSFEDSDGWCRITTLCGDSFAEEILLQLSKGKKLLYFYSDEDQLDCEFLVVDNHTIMRKKCIYYDTPELNKDEGRLACESEHEFLEWHDIDYFMEMAGETPERLFEI